TAGGPVGHGLRRSRAATPTIASPTAPAVLDWRTRAQSAAGEASAPVAVVPVTDGPTFGRPAGTGAVRGPVTPTSPPPASGSSRIGPESRRDSGSRYAFPRSRPQCRQAIRGQPGCPATSVPMTSPAATCRPTAVATTTGSYVVRSPPLCLTVTTPRPA